MYSLESNFPRQFRVYPSPMSELYHVYKIETYLQVLEASKGTICIHTVLKVCSTPLTNNSKDFLV